MTACNISCAINHSVLVGLNVPALAGIWKDQPAGQPTGPDHAGLVAMIGWVPGLPTGSTWTKLVPVLSHWKVKASAEVFSPSELNSTLPCTVGMETPLCSYLMMAALSTPPVFSIAAAATWPTAYASATSALTLDELPPYCLVYSATILRLALP